MRKKLSFVSGLTAFVFFLLTFTSNAFAADATTELDPITSSPQDVLTIETTTPDQAIEDDSTQAIDTLLEADESTSTTDDTLNTYNEEVNQSETEIVSNEVYEYEASYQDAYNNAGDDVYGEAVDLGSRVPDNGVITLDYTTSENNNIILDLINMIDETSHDVPSGLSILTKVKDFDISIPTDYLQNYIFELSIFKDTKTYNSISNVYDLFLFDVRNDTFIRKFDILNKPVTVTFKIDPSKVKNWDDVRLVYIDTKGEQKEFIKPKSLNKETGVITFEVTHFSKYGVFEIASTGPTNNGNGTTNTPTPTPTPTSTTPTGTGSPLPNTATNSFNILIAGLVLLAGGSLLLARKNQHVQ